MSERRLMTEVESALALSMLNRKVDERYGFCRCGCLQKAPIARWSNRTMGWVNGEPKKWCNGHASRCMLPCVAVDEATGCWNWLKRLQPNGYAFGVNFSGNNARGAMHRTTWELVFGPVPQDLDLDHLCRNRKCVNPDHLEPVTRKENVRRGAGVKLNVDLVKSIKRTHQTGLTHREVAALFGLPKSTVSFVIAGSVWGDIV